MQYNAYAIVSKKRRDKAITFLRPREVLESQSMVRGAVRELAIICVDDQSTH